MANLTLAIIWLVAFCFVFIAVLWIALARTRRDLAQLANDLARMAASQKQQSSQPSGEELGKVRENIEQLLDVLEERSATAERQLRQLIEEAKDAAKQIDEATLVAVKVLDAAASYEAPATAAASPPVVEQLQTAALELSQVAPREDAVEREPVSSQDAVSFTEPEPTAPEEAPEFPEPAAPLATSEWSAPAQGSTVEEPLLEPLAVEPAPAEAVVEMVSTDAPVVRTREESDSHDPLSAWAPYKPANRVEESSAQPLPAVTAVNSPAEDREDVRQSEEAFANAFEEPEVVPELGGSAGKENSLAEQDEETPDFQPYAIKPVGGPARTGDAGEAQSAPEPVIFAAPVQAHVYASELNNDEHEIGHNNGGLAADDILPSSDHAEDALGGRSADPYSAVYTLAELGVTDVSEIARRTGLGQTEVEMVLNLWRRH
jgi:hypothetical protein